MHVLRKSFVVIMLVNWIRPTTLNTHVRSRRQWNCWKDNTRVTMMKNGIVSEFESSRLKERVCTLLVARTVRRVCDDTSSSANTVACEFVQNAVEIASRGQKWWYGGETVWSATGDKV